ncbi:MAG: sulfur oxidation protein SoxY, partial [Rhodospirillaceae bacterium]
FTPRSGKASVTARMRLAQKQHVRALAVMSNGSAYVSRKEVNVTVGGCGS